jgi:hypothetical protein
MRLRAGQYLVDGQGLRERFLGDPVLVVHALVLDHRYLRCGASPREKAELQEAPKDRAGRLMP